LRSRTLKLNAEPLQLVDGKLPTLQGVRHELLGTLQLEPTQYLFLELSALAPACLAN